MGQKDSQDSRIHGFMWGKKIHRIHGFTDSVGAKSNQRIQDSRIRLGQKDSQERIHVIPLTYFSKIGATLTTPGGRPKGYRLAVSVIR